MSQRADEKTVDLFVDGQAGIARGKSESELEQRRHNVCRAGGGVGIGHGIQIRDGWRVGEGRAFGTTGASMAGVSVVVVVAIVATALVVVVVPNPTTDTTETPANMAPDEARPPSTLVYLNPVPNANTPSTPAAIVATLLEFGFKFSLDEHPAVIQRRREGCRKDPTGKGAKCTTVLQREGKAMSL